MTLWTIEPRDTLVLRDGRSMDGAGAMLESLRLPFPSTLAGFMRSRGASDPKTGRFLLAGQKDALRTLVEEVRIRGPWLVELDRDNHVTDHLLPAPADAVAHVPEDGGEDAVRLCRLGRSEDGPREGEYLDLEGSLEPLDLSESFRGKPTRLPAFWRWKTMQTWLSHPVNLEGACDLDDGWGLNAGELEGRTNVAIRSDTATAEDGALFTLAHRRFTVEPQRRPGEGRKGARPWRSPAGVHRLALAALCDGAGDGLRDGLFPFAGERRLVHLRNANGEAPAIPEGVVERILSTRRARLILVTPAFFAKGWRPTYPLEVEPGVEVRLRAAAVGRPEIVSGWDWAKWRPKPARRLAVAGTVYFVELGGEDDGVRRWIDRIWWQCVSDDAPSRNDGFGLAILGVDEEVKR